jgi:hypothetical protein
MNDTAPHDVTGIHDRTTLALAADLMAACAKS